MLDSVFRMKLPSRYRRDALCVDIAAPAASGAVFRLLNMHLPRLVVPACSTDDGTGWPPARAQIQGWDHRRRLQRNSPRGS
jgi:hypothetical protein